MRRGRFIILTQVLLAAAVLSLLPATCLAQRGLIRRGVRPGGYSRGSPGRVYYQTGPQPVYLGDPGAYSRTPVQGSLGTVTVTVPTASPLLPASTSGDREGGEIRPASTSYSPDVRAPASLFVRVPAADAELLVEGDRTVSTGTSREFVSPPLQPGKSYTYTLEVRWRQDGRERTRTRQVALHAGDSLDVNLAAPPRVAEVVPKEYREPEPE